MHKKVVQIRRRKYSKPVATVKSLTAELRRNKQDEIGMFNLLAATCDWESY